jgi:hypothetical protein
MMVTMWPRAMSLPADVKASMTLARGERVLAAAPDASGNWLAGSARALHLGSPTGWTVLPWERVDRASWDRDAEQLEVIEVAEFGQPQPHHVHQIGDPGRLLELVHERVTASVLITRHVPVEGSRGLRIVGRRAPGTDGPVIWSALLDDALDPQDPRVAEALEQGLELARGEVTGAPP